MYEEVRTHKIALDEIRQLAGSKKAPKVNLEFIRKVYGILSVQLLFTVASSTFFMFHEPTRLFVLANPGMMMGATFAPFGFLLALHCYKDRHPLNLALLGGFTMSITYTGAPPSRPHASTSPPLPPPAHSGPPPASRRSSWR